MRQTGMELVTGVTGYVGGRLVDRLLEEDRPVRGLARDASRVAPRDGLEAARATWSAGRALRAALDGCHTAYYLVPLHGVGGAVDFAARDRTPPRTSPAPRWTPAWSAWSTWAG